MAHAHSFRITLSNNRTEAEGIRYLLDSEPEWFRPDNRGRKALMEALGLDRTFARAFDLVWVKGRRRNEDEDFIIDATTDSVVLIELKTTKKKLPQNPFGFFFGATKNEFDLAEKLNDRFAFCFTCLHSDAMSHKLLTLRELEPLIKTQRVQYQINLHAADPGQNGDRKNRFRISALAEKG